LRETDFVVVGAGIAGASAAFELSRYGRVVVLEQETFPGYHTTSRSAAIYLPSYGNDTIRSLTAASGPFLRSPTSGFAEHPLLTDRGCLVIARCDQLEALRARHALNPRDSVWIDAAVACEKVPVLRRDYVAAALFESSAMDMDVNGLQTGFLRNAKTRGAEIITSAPVEEITKKGGCWHIRASKDEWVAPVVVNAAGAWASIVAARAGAQRIEVQAFRRTAAIIEPPPNVRIEHWPAVLDVDEQFYFKPESGRLLLSPADETLCAPCDVQPDDLDIAIAVDRIQRAADLPVRRVLRSWAGLRCFVPDRTPVVGFDRDATGFMWLAALGGYGIQTSPAVARLVAAVALGKELPDDLLKCGVSTDDLLPSRPTLNPVAS
jgi:D-arginine dehydrogenase